MKSTIVVVLAMCVIGVVKASAQSRFDVGLLLGSTRTTDEAAVLQFDRGTTYQATFAWRVVATGIRVPVPHTRRSIDLLAHRSDRALWRRRWRLRTILRVEAQGRPQPQSHPTRHERWGTRRRRRRRRARFRVAGVSR